MMVWAYMFGCFFGGFVVAAVFALPLSAVVISKRFADSAASEIRC